MPDFNAPGFAFIQVLVLTFMHDAILRITGRFCARSICGSNNSVIVDIIFIDSFIRTVFWLVIACKIGECNCFVYFLFLLFSSCCSYGGDIGLVVLLPMSIPLNLIVVTKGVNSWLVWVLNDIRNGFTRRRLYRLSGDGVRIGAGFSSISL